MGKWKDKGSELTGLDMIADVVTLGHNPFDIKHTVENIETGEQKQITVSPHETVGQAIERGGDKFVD